MEQLPYFDNSKVDLCLITHFHMDHSGAVPHFVNRCGFRGKVYMTHPTKSICKMLWQDFARMQKITSDRDAEIYNAKDIEQCERQIELIDFHEQIETPDGIKITCFTAGHVLGAAMFQVGDDSMNVEEARICMDVNIEVDEWFEICSYVEIIKYKMVIKQNSNFFIQNFFLPRLKSPAFAFFIPVTFQERSTAI